MTTPRPATRARRLAAASVLVGHVLLVVGLLRLVPGAAPESLAGPQSATADRPILQVSLLRAVPRPTAPVVSKPLPKPAAQASTLAAVAPNTLSWRHAPPRAVLSELPTTPESGPRPAAVEEPTPTLGETANPPIQLTTAAAPFPPSPASLASPPLRQAQPDHAHCPPAPYPPLLRERGVEGVVRLLVRVSAQGRAAEARVAQGSGFRLFDEAAVQRAMACRFVPAQRGDEAVEAWVDFAVRFALVG